MTDDKISLKEFFEKLLGERKLHYEERLRYIEALITAVDNKHTAAETATKELMVQTYNASEKAILKSEDSQKELNAKNNEFRAQLKDQAEVFMPRNEFNAMYGGLESKLIAVKSELDRQIEMQRKELQGLRESRSMGEGKNAGVKDFRDFTGWGIAILLALLALAQYLKK